MKAVALLLCVASLLGCQSELNDDVSDTTGVVDTTGERETLSTAQCEQRGGQIIGDIGDGRVHRADYVCPSGKKPMGSIAQEGERIMIDGAVCCPAH